MTHPYPKHVVEAVAKALMKSSEGRDAFGAGGDWEAAGSTIKQEFLGHANAALQALWDASEVRTFGDISRLPGTAIIANREGNTASLSDFLGIQEVGAPAHVIFWGDAE